MTIQYIIVGLIVFSATALTAVKLVRFFISPASKCDGCSGCKLQELKAK